MENTYVEKHLKLLILTNKRNPIDYKAFDWIENVTTDEEMVDNPKIRGKRFYQNPLFWRYIFGMPMSAGYSQKTINEMTKFVNNPNDAYGIIDQEMIEMLMAENIFSPTKVKRILDIRPEIDKNRVAIISVGNINSDYYKMLVENYEIVDDTGSMFIEACKNNKTEIIDDLLAKGEDVNKNEAMGFLLLVKHGDYTNALKLLDKGVDIHTKQDLAYKAFLVNDSKRFCKEGEEAAHNEIMGRFKAEKCEGFAKVSTEETEEDKKETEEVIDAEVVEKADDK